MKRSFLFYCLLFAAGARADITLIGTDHSVHVLYREGNEIRYQECKKGIEPPTDRNCAHAKAPYADSFALYHRRLMMLYHVWPDYSGENGLSRISVRIERLSRTLESPDPITGDEKEKIEAGLRESKEQQTRILKGRAEVLQYLSAGKNRAIDAEFQKSFYLLHDAFFPLWYDGRKFVWAVGEVVNWDQLDTVWGNWGSIVSKRACRHLWRPARTWEMLERVGDTRVLELLGGSDLASVANGEGVWLQSVIVAQLGARVHNESPNLRDDTGISTMGLGAARILCVRE